MDMAFPLARLARWGVAGLVLSVVAAVARTSARELEQHQKAPRARAALRTVSRLAGRRSH
jgi:hypothetical protein